MATEPASAAGNRTGMAARPAPGQALPVPRRFDVRGWLLWTAGFLSFPIAGIAGQAAAGRINDAASALAGGLVAGAVIGTGQWLAARRPLAIPRAWIPATAAAMGIGLLAGAWAAGYAASPGELALMGAITGLPLGAAQAFLLRDRVARPWAWAAAMPPLWALGWTITAAAGIDVGNQYAVFGATGAITFMALSGALLYQLRATTPATPPPPPRPPTGTAGS
jgi:hypothetical protein